MRYLCIAVPVSLVGACALPSVAVRKPETDQADGAVIQMWAREIRANAQTGDVILSRSYSLVGDVITWMTAGESVSHASIYDADTGTVIEAINPRVREVPLEALLARNRYVIIVRPPGLSASERQAAVERARAVVGAKFDFAGMFGIGSGDRFYCSELVVWAMSAGAEERPLVVSPSSLMDRGEVVYFSGLRDDPQIRAAALAHRQLMAERRPDETHTSPEPTLALRRAGP